MNLQKFLLLSCLMCAFGCTGTDKPEVINPVAYVERDREGSSKGSESEEKGRGERQDQRRKRPEYLDQETQQTPCPGRKMQGHSAERGNDQCQSGSCHGTSNGHLDCVKERQQDLRKIGEIRPHHVGRQI